MISHPINRVQAIKSKFENLNVDNAPIKQRSQLYKLRNEFEKQENKEKPHEIGHDNIYNKVSEHETDSSDGYAAKPNVSALYKIDVKRSASDSKSSLIRQVSDPGKKLHRSHAFRCDRSQKLTSPKSPKRHGSCNGRSETSEFLKMERKLSKDRLKKLGNVLEQQMKKENFVLYKSESKEAIVGIVKEVSTINSMPDVDVPPHILAMYAQVIKPKKNDEKHETMTDSGVSSETENLDDDKSGRVKRITTQFENAKESTEETKTNLDVMEDLAGSSETMKLERKNPHLKLTDTLKKALKQPLPPGPPPKKPPRIFGPEINEKEKSDTKRKLEKLEQVLMKREAKKENKDKNIYDIAEEDVSLKKPKEVHYLCTEILDITQRTLLPNQNESPLKNCLNKLTCVANQSMSSLPYTKLNSSPDPNHNMIKICSCSQNSLDKETSPLRTFMSNKCSKCHINDDKDDQFKCHLSCKCREEKSEFFLGDHIYDKCDSGKSNLFLDDHIYDEPYVEGRKSDKSVYGTLNSVKLNSVFSKSLEDLHTKKELDVTIYDVPNERPSTPDVPTKTDFQKLRENFENGPKPTQFNRSISNISKQSISNLTRSNQQINQSNSNLTCLTNLNGSNSNLFLSNLNQSQSNLTEQSITNLTMTNYQEINRSISNLTSSFKRSQSNLNSEPMTKFNQSNSNLTSQSNLNKSTPNQSDSTNQSIHSKPMILTPKPTEMEDGRYKKKSSEGKYATEVKRYKKEAVGFSLPKRNPQLDVDRENLNRLMNEIYETVTAACIMADSKPGSFPTDQSDGTTSEESVKLTRSLTEKRKNYVRRVSSRLAYLEPKNIKQTRFRHQTSICSYKSEIIDNPYSTFRSWKSFRTSQNNLTRDKMETDSKFNLTDSTGNVLSNEFDSEPSIDNLSIDEKTGCVDIELPFEPRENGLFNVCILVGYNNMSAQAYVKSVFPPQVQLPQHIENLVFPETMSGETWRGGIVGESPDQCYSFVLTDERGERAYGYCRRVLPEGATTCLPLCYCLIGKYRAPGFYYKVLQEIESHHGSSDEQIHSILQQLFDTDFPSPGEEITLTYSKQDFKPTSTSDLTNLKDTLLNDITRHINNRKNSSSSDGSNPDSTRNDTGSTRNCINTTRNVTDSLKNPDSSRNVKDLKTQFSVLDVPSSKNVTDNSKCRTMPVMRRSEGDGQYDLSSDYYDYENNNGPMRLLLSLDIPKSKSIKQPLDPRAEEESSSQLLDSLGAGLLIKVFGSLLLERKVIIRAARISEVSSRLEAIQACLYPFVWQQPLISLAPADIQQELVHAPLPMLAGMLPGGQEEGQTGTQFEEGMLVDLTHPSKVLFYQGDESTILPTTSYKTLKTSLQMESTKNKDKNDTKMRNMLISEAFLRFFVDILGDFWRYFRFGERKEGELGRGDVIFDKDIFVKNAASKQNQYFLEWFTETAMFNHFIQNMSVRYKDTYSQESPKSPQKVNSEASKQEKPDLLNHQYKMLDCPTPNFYQLFEERVLARRESKGVDRSGYRNALHKRVRLLKSRLKDLVG